MSGTERKEKHWRTLIEKIRSIYTGPIVYNTNHGREDEVKWFDAVDFIGTSAYFKVGQVPGDAKEHMLEVWNRVGNQMQELSERYQKQIIFMEIGCRSASGCAMMPWDFTHTEFDRSEEEQANFYDSCLTVFADKQWFAGAFWWDWSTEVYVTEEEAKQNTGFDIHLKKAEDVLRRWYS